MPDTNVSMADVGGLVSDVLGDVLVPSDSLNISAPEVPLPSVDVDMPSVGGGASGDPPSADVKLTVPDLNVDGRDASLTTGLATGAAATIGPIGAGLGLKGEFDKPKGDVDAGMFIPNLPSVDTKKPKKKLFGGVFSSSKENANVGIYDLSFTLFPNSCQVFQLVIYERFYEVRSV